MPAAVNHRDEPSDTPFDTGRFYRAPMPSRAEGVERRQAEALRDAAIADRDELATKTDIAGASALKVAVVLEVSPGRGSNDAEQLGGDGDDERGLKGEHPAHFGAQGVDRAVEVGLRGGDEPLAGRRVDHAMPLRYPCGMGTGGWMWRRGASPEELEAKYGLRPLTWRDGLLWVRVCQMLGLGVLWTALVLWILSGLYDVGPITVIVVACIGCWLGAVTVAGERFERDLPRWPRRLDPD